MKKAMIILLSLAMVFCGAFAGCAKQSVGDYTAKLYAADSECYNADIMSGPIDDVENENVKQEVTFPFNGNSVKLTYYRTANYPGRHLVCYCNGRGPGYFDVGYYADTGNIAYVSYPYGALIIQETLTTEAEYRAWVEDYLAELMPDEELSQYEYSCETDCAISEGDSYGYRTYDSFYTPQNTNEELKYYSFYYAKVFNGYESADLILVTIKIPSGDEPCYVIGANYSNHEFDNFTSLNLNKEKVKAAVEEKFRSAIKSESGFKFESCEIKDYTLIYENGTFGILCGVSTTVRDISGITPEPDYPDDADPTPEDYEWYDTITTYEKVFVTIPASDYTVGERP